MKTRLSPKTIAVLAYLAEAGPSSVRDIHRGTNIAPRLVVYILQNRGPSGAGDLRSNGGIANRGAAARYSITESGRARLDGDAPKSAATAEAPSGPTIVATALARRSALEAAWARL